MAGACVCALCGSSATAIYSKCHRTTVKNWTAWSTGCSRSLCSVFSLPPDKFLQPLTVGPYCLQCCTLIGDIHFTLRQVRTLEKRLRSLKARLERQILLTVPFGDWKVERFGGSVRDMGNRKSVVELLAEELRRRNGNGLTKVEPGEVLENLAFITETDLLGDFVTKELPPDIELDEDWATETTDGDRPDTLDSNLQPQTRPSRRCARLEKGGDDNEKQTMGTAPQSRSRKESVCNFCDATFRSRTQLKAHIGKEHPDERLECKVCKARYRSEKSLETHTKNLHGGVFPLHCPVCQHGFLSAEDLSAHKLVHESSNPFTCSTCQQIFSNSADLEAHIREHVNPFRCDRPGCKKKTFITQTLLSRHMRTHTRKNFSCGSCQMKCIDKAGLNHHILTHMTERTFQCDQCPAVFKSMRGLQSHASSHDEIKSCPCRLCGKSFSTNSNRLRHEEIHAGTKSYVCSNCGKTFTTKHNLWSHNYTVHHPSGIARHQKSRKLAQFKREGDAKTLKGVGSMTSQVDRSRSFSNELHECSVCSVELSGVNSFRVHVATEHPDFRFECTACPAKYRLRLTLDDHIKSVHGGLYPLFCTICRQGFNSSEELEAHESVHSSSNPFTCSICQKTFTNSSNLERHIRSHRNLFHCPHSDCEVSFPTIAKLKQHKRTAHNLNTFMCEICGAKFSTRAVLRMHMETHGRKKAFKCHLCPSKFNQSGTLKQHVKRHFEKKTYPCTICGRSFSFNENRLRHEQTHARATFPCSHCTKTFTTKNCLWGHENGVHKGGYRKQAELEKLKKRAKTMEGKTQESKDTAPRLPSNCPNKEAGTGELPRQAD